MSPLRSAAATLGIVASLVLLGWIGFRLYLAERPLPPRTQVAPPRVLPAPPGRRLLLVLVDGLREDAAFDAALGPNFAHLAASGASGISITQPMTLTTMSVVSIGTGMTPSVSWSLKNFDAEPIQDEHVFSLLKAAGYRIGLFGDACWSQLYGHSAARTLPIGDHGWADAAADGLTPSDRQTFDAARKALDDEDFDVVVAHVTGVDKMSHKFGSAFRDGEGRLLPYASAWHAVDAEVGRLWARYGRDTTFLVISDHGVSGRGTHGGGEPETRRAPFVWVGPGIRHTPGIEQPLTAVAATLTGLFGVRAPRLAESGPNLSVLDLPPSRGAALTLAHLEAREGYTASYLALVGSTPGPPEPQRARRAFQAGHFGEALRMASEHLRLLEALCLRADGAHGWLRPVGLALGLLLQLALALAIATAARLRRPLAVAGAWAGLSFLLLYFHGWQFGIIEVLGLPFQSLPLFLLRGGIIAVALGGVLAVRRYGGDARETLAWLGVGVLCVALGQSVTRWPYGPLAEMYRTLLVLGLAVFVRRWWAVLLPLLVFWASERFIGAGPEVRIVNSQASLWISMIAYVGALVFLFRPGRAWAVVALVALVAMAFRLTDRPLLVKTLLPALAVPLLVRRDERPRDLLIAMGLTLQRALGTDVSLVLLIGFGAVAVLLSDRPGPRSAPLGVAAVVLANLSFFYEAGYAFSFSAIDVSVTFAATRDAIHLGEGFVLLLAQHLGPWLVLVAALLHRMEQPMAVAYALVGACAVQAWGAFVTFEYLMHDHWFTMHAVPLFVFSMCNAALVGCAVILSSWVQSRRPAEAVLAT